MLILLLTICKQEMNLELFGLDIQFKWLVELDFLVSLSIVDAFLSFIYNKYINLF